MNAEPRARLYRLSLAFLVPALGMAAATAGTSGDDRPHLVVMASGDRFQGTVTSFSPDKGLSLSYPDALEPLQLKFSSIRSLASPASILPEAPETKAVITFTNGDTVPAEIRSFDGKSLGITTPWAGGNHDFPWEKVERIVFADGQSKRLFQGPMLSQDWKFTGRRSPEGEGDSGSISNWRIDKNEIVAENPGSASVNPQLPDQVAVEFDVEWTGQLNFSIALFSDAFLPADENEPNGPTVADDSGKQGEIIPLHEGIALDLNPHNLILRTHSMNQGQDMIGSAQMPAQFRSRSRARMTIRIDRAAGTFAVWREGKLVSKWKDIGEIPGKGKGISFWQHHNNGTLTIRRLIVKNWNGKLDEETPRVEPGKDVLIAADGSRLTGELRALKDDRWNIRGQIGDLELARHDILHIVRAGKDVPPETDESSSGGEKTGSPETEPLATITLAGGHVFHLGEISLAPSGKLSGQHPILGGLDFPFAIVESIQFSKPASNKP